MVGGFGSGAGYLFFFLVAASVVCVILFAEMYGD